MPTPRTPAGRALDALSLLKADHDKVKSLFRAFEALRDDTGDDARKCELVDEICYALTVHSMLEDDLFYPEVRAAIEDGDMMDEAEQAHSGARDLIGRLEVMHPGDDHFDTTVAVLGEEIIDHIDKEESDLFAAVRLAGIDLDALGARLARRKAALDDDLTAPPILDAPMRPHAGVRRPPRAPN